MSKPKGFRSLRAFQCPEKGICTKRCLSYVNRLFLVFNQNIEETFIPELGQHLKHMDADLLRIIIQAGADNAETIWRQNSAIQLTLLND